MSNKQDLQSLIKALEEELNVMLMRVERLEKFNTMLNDECASLRQQLKYAEQQVYNGSTM
jgi:chaperonin cofactor prefoldin